MNKRDLGSIHLVDLLALFTHPFVVRYNGLSLIAMPSLDIVVTFFDIIIKIQSEDNKHNRFVSVFTQELHAMQDACKKRLISSSDI